VHTRAIRVVYTRITPYATHAHTTRIHTTYLPGRQAGRYLCGTYHGGSAVVRTTTTTLEYSGVAGKVDARGSSPATPKAKTPQVLPSAPSA
jgi:hypothetical protein